MTESAKLSIVQLKLLRALAPAPSFGRAIIDASGGKLNKVSVYGNLKRLVERGLLERQVERTDVGPPRHLYAITDRGRALLAQHERLETFLKGPT